MARDRCCGCNGPLAICKNCRCARNKIPCVSCYPSRNNKCNNFSNPNPDLSAPHTPASASSAVVAGQSQPADADGIVAGSNLTTNNNCANATSIIKEDILSFSRAPILNRIPKGARHQAAATLCQLLNKACESDSVNDWQKLFRFSVVCLQKPKRGGIRRSSLASGVIKNIQRFMSDPLAPIDNNPVRKPPRPSEAEDARAKHVAKKIASGDVKGAIRVISSNDSFLPFDPDTFSILESKHPPRHPSSKSPDPLSAETITEALKLSEEQIRKAIHSFPGDSAGGCDLLRPQHLKDLISKSSGDSGLQLLGSLTRICNKMLRGDLPKEVLPVFYGASLIAFSKPNGGVRPIAIGNTLRRLTAKAAAFSLKADIKHKLSPYQLGVSVSSGAEAIVHSGRSYCNSKLSSAEPTAFLKIDFENAFNTIRRDVFLSTIREELTCLYPFLYQCYSNISFLFFNGFTLYSSEGIQQGDPLGPLCFSLCIQSLIKRLSSEFNVWYLDDGTLAGDPDKVRDDFETILAEQDSLGLRVNLKKCELSILGSDLGRNNIVSSSFSSQFPDMKLVPQKDINLLGVPLFQEGIDEELSSRLCALKLTCSRLESLDHHDALFLLKNVFFIPKLLYLLRSFPCHGNPILKDFDLCMKVCLEKITNCRFDRSIFRQASLPIKLGGLGIRRTEDISLPAFIASSMKCSVTVDQLISKTDASYFTSLMCEAVMTWKSVDSQLVEPITIARQRQKSWDLPLAGVVLKQLLNNASDPTTRSRLLAVSSPDAGVWLNAIPIPSLGLKLDNESLRIAVALRLGVQVAMPYKCICGTSVEGTATHGLDCRKNGGKHARHFAVNDILHRALNAAGVPSHLEPTGLSREDGKRPDGATILPFEKGQCLVWDFTCVNTVAASHIKSAAERPGAPSEAAEVKKIKKYSALSTAFKFIPIAVETLGPWGPEAKAFVTELGKRLSTATGDPRSSAFLKQRISLAVQRGNAICIKQSLPAGIDFNEAFYI